MKFGASLSHKQCNVFKVEWKECVRLADEMGLELLRLPVYWNELQPTIDSPLDFSPLREQLEYIAESTQGRLEVCLIIGMKSLWWPEFYLPEGATLAEIEEDNDNKKGEAKTARRIYFGYLQKLVELANSAAIVTEIQVENEPLNHSGPDKLNLSTAFLQQVIDFVAKRSEKPLLSTVWLPTPIQSQYQKVLQLDNLQKVGAHYYYDFPKRFLNYTDFYTKSLFWLRLNLSADNKRRTIISELQAKPWKSKDIRAKFISPDKFIKKIEKMLGFGLAEYWFWGLEFWLFRKMKYNDSAWIDAFSLLVKRQRTQP